MTTSIKITKNSSLNPPQDSSVYEKVPTISDPLSTAGWIRSNTGESSAINYNYRFDLYIRRRNLWEMMSGNDDISKVSSAKSLNTNEKIPDKSNTFPTNPGSVSNPSMGMHKCDLTPSDWVPASEALPVLSSFVKYPSLAAIRTNKPVIVIAYDSEWFYCDPENESDRHMLTWQFAVISGSDLMEFVFVKKLPGYDLSLETALGRYWTAWNFPAQTSAPSGSTLLWER